MRKSLWAALVVLLVAAGLPKTVLAADLAAYGRLPSIEEIELSPDGKSLAMIATNGEKRSIIVRDIATEKVVLGVDAGMNKVRYLKWADADNLIIVMSKTTNMFSAGIQAPTADYSVGTLFTLSTHKQRPLLGTQTEESLNILLDAPTVRTQAGKTVLYVKGVAFSDGEGIRSVFSTTLGGQTRMAYQGRVDAEDYLVDDQGHVVLESTFEDHSGKAGLLMRVSGSLRTIGLPPNFAQDLSLLGFTADGKSYLVRYRTQDDSVVGELSADGVWKVRDDLSGDGVMIDPMTDRFLGSVSEDGDKVTDYKFADPMDQRTWRGISKAFPDSRLTFEGFSADHKRVLVLVDSPTEGQAYAMVDIATGMATYVGEVYYGVTPADIFPVRTIAYKAADGLEITGYLTLPKGAGKDPKNLPLVVLPHGGPAVRDDLSFDWWSQALAAQGYAVLRPNYRGSRGLGEDFMKAGFGEWGKKMQTDLSDGVRYLAKDGIIDPKRVCIVGASYGGYAALAGATLDLGVYRCAASIAGPADLRQMLISDRDNKGYDTLRYWSKFMGVDGFKDPDLAKISPAAHASDVTIPILLIHGKDDTVVFYKQSQIMADALKKAGKPYEFVTLDSEDHWLSSGVTRLKMLQSVVEFLKKNNPPD